MVHYNSDKQRQAAVTVHLKSGQLLSLPVYIADCDNLCYHAVFRFNQDKVFKYAWLLFYNLANSEV